MLRYALCWKISVSEGELRKRLFAVDIWRKGHSQGYYDGLVAPGEFRGGVVNDQADGVGAGRDVTGGADEAAVGEDLPRQIAGDLKLRIDGGSELARMEAAAQPRN